MVRTKIKQNFKFNQKIIDSAVYRVVLSDKRISSAVSDWSILNLWAFGGSANQKLRFDAITYSSTRSKDRYLRSFSDTSSRGSFLWNSFVCANYLSQPRTIFYGRCIARQSRKSKLLVTHNELSKTVFAWLVSTTSVEISGRGLGTRVLLPPIPMYFRLWEFWRSVNGRWGEELSTVPSFLSRGWGAAFLPFFGFSLKNAFSLSGNFATFYPFFSFSRGVGGLAYRFIKIFAASNVVGLVLNYTDQLPYESRTEFFFRTNSAYVRGFEHNNSLRQRSFTTFTFKLSVELTEPSLGDRVNPLIPYYFYFNEFDFFKLFVKVTNFRGNVDSLLANEFLRLISPWSRINVRAYIFNLWKLLVNPSLIKNGVTLRYILVTCKAMYRDHVNRWIVFFYQRGRLWRRFFENFCKNSNRNFWNKNYSYNNLTRPFFLFLYLLHLGGIQVHTWFSRGFFRTEIFLINRGYLFSIKGLFAPIFRYRSAEKYIIYVGFLGEFWRYIKLFLKTLVYFWGIAFQKFWVRSRFGSRSVLFILLIFLLFNWSKVGFFVTASLLIFLLGLVFRRFITWTDVMHKTTGLPRVNLFFHLTRTLLVNFRFVCELFGRLFLEFWLSYRGLYVLCAVASRFIGFWLRFYLVLLSNFKRICALDSLGARVLLSFLDSAFFDKNRWRLDYSVFYFTPIASFWHIFNVNRVVNGGYGWWITSAHAGLQSYVMQYYLNRLTTLSYESAQLVAAKLGSNSVYGGVNIKDLSFLTCGSWCVSTFRALPFWGTIYSTYSFPSFAGGSLSRANLPATELANKELFLKFTAATSADYSRITWTSSVSRFLWLFVIAVWWGVWFFLNAIVTTSRVIYNFSLFTAKFILVGAALQLAFFLVHFLIFFCTLKVYLIWYVLVKCFVIFLLLRK